MKQTYNKWMSRRWIVTVWSMCFLTVITILGIIFKEDAYANVAMALVAIPVAFTSLETLNKKWKHDIEQSKDGQTAG